MMGTMMKPKFTFHINLEKDRCQINPCLMHRVLRSAIIIEKCVQLDRFWAAQLVGFCEQFLSLEQPRQKVQWIGLKCWLMGMLFGLFFLAIISTFRAFSRVSITRQEINDAKSSTKLIWAPRVTVLFGEVSQQIAKSWDSEAVVVVAGVDKIPQDRL